MKIQSLAVIFAIILLPIIVILSYYIHKEIDTIVMQTSYDTKLIDATHDAMAAFELNTANEDLSNVSDALRSIIVASKNIFFNTLATNLGISNANESYLQRHVPAMLFTLYDGYYIYSPTKTAEILVAKPTSAIPGVKVTERPVVAGDKGTSGTADNVTFNVGSFDGEKDDVNNFGNEYGRLLYRKADASGKPIDSYSTRINSNTYFKDDYILKSYMPYSARYKDGTNYDLTINYTLDNYITVMGYIGNIYYSKTGYLIADETISRESPGSSKYKAKAIYTNSAGTTIQTVELLEYNEIVAENICLSGDCDIEISINPFTENEKRVKQITESFLGPDHDITYNLHKNPLDDISTELQNQLNITINLPEGDVTLKDDFQEHKSYGDIKERLKYYYDEIEKQYVIYRTADDAANKAAAKEKIIQINYIVQAFENRLETMSAIAYYVKAQIFSNWVYDILGDECEIRERNLQDDLAADNNSNYTTDLSASEDNNMFHHSFTDSDILIFDRTQNPEKVDSSFSNHKFEVIRNSIQYNLNLVLSMYDMMIKQYDVKLPMLSDPEWENILTNVSIVSFMQGMNCGLKIYNNYAVVSSVNNELTVTPSEIYYTKSTEYNAEDFNETGDRYYYHRVDCLDFPDTEDVISFRSKEVKYDKIWDKNIQAHKYDHKNLACYSCIIANNYEKHVRNEAGQVGSETDRVLGYSSTIYTSALSETKRKVYYRGVASAREQLYKTNALTDSNGYETIYDVDIRNPSAFVKTNWTGASGSAEVTTGMTAPSKELKHIRAIELTVRDLECPSDPDIGTVTFEIKINGAYVKTLGTDNETEFVLNVQETPQTVVIPVYWSDSDNSALNSIILEKTQPTNDVDCVRLNLRVIYE